MEMYPHSVEHCFSLIGCVILGSKNHMLLCILFIISAFYLNYLFVLS